MPVAFSKLKKNGWLRIELDPQDGRKSLYFLRNPENVIKEVAKQEEEDAKRRKH